MADGGDVVDLDADYLQHPHEWELQLRKDEPIRRARTPDGLCFWLVTRYADVRDVLTHPGIRRDGAPTADRCPARQHPESAPRDDHPADLARLATRVAAVADRLLAPMPDRGDVDLMASYATPLSAAVDELAAGRGVIADLIGNAVFALLREPEQWALLCDEPDLASNAVEEALRVEGPVHLAAPRRTAEPVAIGGVEIPANEFVVVSLLSANRDGERFEHPHLVDVRRPVRGHLAFGHGVHHCPGAPVARLVARIALRRLAECRPGLRLAVDPEELTWRHSMAFRGLEALPVTISG